jgi:hypothetical protein
MASNTIPIIANSSHNGIDTTREEIPEITDASIIIIAATKIKPFTVSRQFDILVFPWFYYSTLCRFKIFEMLSKLSNVTTFYPKA